MQNILLYLSIASPLVPLITGWKDKSLLWWYALAGFLADVTGYVTKTYNGHTPEEMYNLFLLIEFTCFAFFYRNRVFSNRKVFYLLYSANIIAFIVTNFPHYNVLNYYWIALNSVIYIAMIILSFARILKEKKTMFLEKSQVFWVNVAILIYSSGNCLVFLFERYLLSVDRPLMILIWVYFFLPLNITKNVTLGYALTKENES